MTIHTAIRAMKENMDTLIDPKSDPVAYNTSLALLEILLALQKNEKDVRDLEQKVQYLQSTVNSLRR